MKKAFLAFAFLALAVPAMAQDNVPTGLGDDVACVGGGTCKVPNFTFLGQVVKYKGVGVANPLSIDAADCCLGGDKYSASVTAGGFKGSVTTSFVAASSCTTVWTPGATARINTGGAASAIATMKIIKAGGGFPAGAYVRLSSGAWVQTAGSDQCGF